MTTPDPALIERARNAARAFANTLAHAYPGIPGVYGASWEKEVAPMLERAFAAFAAEVAEEAKGPGSVIYDAIRYERLRQERLKAEGKFSFSASTGDLGIALAILMEEVGEVAREAMALLGVVKESGDRIRYRKELVQVAAVAVAMIEATDAALAALPAKEDADGL